MATAVVSSLTGSGTVPVGGATGTVLTKVSATDYDLSWAAAPAAMQASNSAVSAAADYVARIKIAADTTYRAFIGLSAADEGGIELGPGGAADRDIVILRQSYSSKVQISVTDPAGAAGAGITLTSYGVTVAQQAHVGLRVSGDTAYRARFTTSINSAAQTPGIALGDGSSAADIRMFRNGAGLLSLDSGGTANPSRLTIEATAAQRSSLEARVAADTFNRTALYGDATLTGIEFGSGAAARDTNLYRSAASTLKTDDRLVIAFASSTALQLQITDTTAGAGITIGGDVLLYRSAGSTLKTDGDLVVVGEVTSNNLIGRGRYGLQAGHVITGGGTITFDASGNLYWGTRFIVISHGNSTDGATSGYFDISCPTSGTITGVGGHANVTATASGVPLGTWDALYYILPFGSGNASVAGNFRVATYTSAFVPGSGWVLVALYNGDSVQCYVAGIRRYLAQGRVSVSGRAPVPVIRTYTSGGNTWTKPAGLAYIVVECQAGGGGGGGTALTAAGENASAGNGGGGGFGRKLYTAGDLASLTTATATVGAGGAASAASNSAGGTGGSSTFAGTGLTTLTVTGGTGGSGSASSAGHTENGAGSGGGVTAGSPDFAATGDDGDRGTVLAATYTAKRSGSSFMGGASGQGATGAGSVGALYGGGGTGATAGASVAARAGGAGGAGTIIITEHFE